MIFPNDIGFSACEISSTSKSYLTESNSMQTIATGNGAHRWEFSLTTISMKERDFRRASAFFNSLGGKITKFDVTLPMISKPLGLVTGQVTALASYSIGDNSISLNNYVPEIGDFMRFVGHSKVYQITDTAGSSCTVFPSLIKAVANNEVIKVNDVYFTVRMDSDVSKLSITTKKITKFKFKCIEAF